MKAEQYQERKETIAGWPVKIVSYKAGNAYHVAIHNQEPGAWIVKRSAPTLEEAEKAAREKAAESLSKTRRIPAAGGETCCGG